MSLLTQVVCNSSASEKWEKCVLTIDFCGKLPGDPLCCKPPYFWAHHNQHRHIISIRCIEIWLGGCYHAEAYWDKMDAIFKFIFLYENWCIFIQIILKFITMGVFNNKVALVQIMAWCQACDKPLSEPMMAYFAVVYASHSMCKPMLCWINSSPPEQNGHHFGRRYFQVHFLEWKWENSDSNFTENCSHESNWQYRSFGSGNGLAPNRQQAIIWTNADPLRWHIYAALGGDELISGNMNSYL